jgi:DNA-binding CsgD family transcriptional regulator
MEKNIQKEIERYQRILESQYFIEEDLDYSILDKYKNLLSYLDEVESSSYEIFDLFKRKHICFSPKFGFMLGYNSEDLKIEGEINYDARIHPDDFTSMIIAGNYFMEFALNRSKEEVLNFKLISDFRILNKENNYLRVTKQYKPIEIDKNGNFWLALCIINLSADQDISTPHKIRLVNTNNGEIFYFNEMEETPFKKSPLSERETQILDLIAQGSSSKIISSKLFISLNTVNTHRQNIIEKLGVSNTFEAVKIASDNQWIKNIK